MKAIVAAVANLRYPVERVTFLQNGFPCGMPFLSAGIYSCALMDAPPLAAAHVYLAGTDEVAAVTIPAVNVDGAIPVKVVALRVPPSSFRP